MLRRKCSTMAAAVDSNRSRRSLTSWSTVHLDSFHSADFWSSRSCLTRSTRWRFRRPTAGIILPPNSAIGSVRRFRIPEKHESQMEPSEKQYLKVTAQDLVSLLVPERGKLAAAGAALVLSSFSSMAVPTIFGIVVDALAAAPNVGAAEDDILRASLMMAGVVVTGSVATFVRVSLLDIAGQSIGRSLRKRLFEKLMAQEIGFYDVNRGGELANRLSTDVHEVAEHLVESLSVLATASVTACVAAGFLLVTCPSLAPVPMIVVPAVGVGGTIYAREARQLSKVLLDALAASTQIATERFSSIRVVRSFAAEDREIARYASTIDRSYGTAQRLASLEGRYTASVFFVSNGATLAVLWLGAGLVSSGDMTVGSLAAFCLYSHNLSDAVGDMTDGIAGVLRARGAGGRLFSLLDRRPRLGDGTIVPNTVGPRGHIDFRAIRFSYPSRPDIPVLEDLRLDVQPGEIVGITGTSGCGKSTLAFLLEHMYEPSGGGVYLDGMDVRMLDPGWLRRHVAVVGQKPCVFSGTVLDNIAYSDPGASLEEVRRAATLANADEFVSQMPEQYHSEVGERGSALSGGQRQRLALARALLSKPRVLVLDEATSALDAEGEMLVQERVLAFLREGARTGLVITHHIELLKDVDRVVVLRDGRVAQSGPYQDLVEDKEGLLHALIRASKHATGSS